MADNENLGCTLLVWLVLASVGFLIWVNVSECGLADKFDYVTKKCALAHLQTPTCQTNRDIFEVDEVQEANWKDNQGQEHQVRSVIYEFRKRPVDGPVSAQIFRDTISMTKYKDRWVAGCEPQN